MEETELRRILAAVFKKIVNYQEQKNKRCIVVQNNLRYGEKLSQAESIHLQNCKDCQFLRNLAQE